MLAIRIELDATHGRRALGLTPDAPLDTMTLATALADVRARLLDRLAAAYPGAKLTVALRFGRYGAGRTRVRLTTGPATWRRGDAERALITECAEALRDTAIAAVAEENARRRGRAALDEAAAAADVRNFSPLRVPARAERGEGLQQASLR
jgi:hypothetical protein